MRPAVAAAALLVGCAHGTAPPPASAPAPAPAADGPAPSLYVLIATDDAALHDVLARSLESDPRFTTTRDDRLDGFELRVTTEHVVLDWDPGTRVVECTVSLLVVTHPAESMFASVDGTAQTDAAANDDDIDRAAGECNAVVARDLVERKVRPALLRKVSSAR